MTVYVRLSPPFQWVRTEAGAVLDFGEVGSPAEYPLDNEEAVVGVAPSAAVTSHRVSLPAKTRKQFNQALPYALEELISQDIDSVFCLCPNWKADTELTVYCIDRDEVATWSGVAIEHKIPATRLVPEFGLVPEHSVAEVVVAVTDDSAQIHYQDGQGLEIAVDLLALWLQEVPNDTVIAINDEATAKRLAELETHHDIRHWPCGDRLAHWLEHRTDDALDLWPEGWRPPSRKSAFAPFAWPLTAAALAGMVMVGGLMLQYFSLHKEIELITDESQALVKQLIPELDYVEPGKEREIAERVLSQRASGTQTFSLPMVLNAIAPIMASERVTLKEIRMRESEVIVHSFLTNLGQADAIRERLNRMPGLRVRLQGSSNEKGLIVATYAITAQPGGES